MTKDTFNPRQLEAIRAIRNWIARQGYFPSVRELMGAMDYKSPRSAHIIMEQLESLGAIKKTAAGSYQMLANPNFGVAHAKTTLIPLVGSAACGAPILAEQNIEGFIPVSTSFIKPGSKFYLLRAKGDSMNAAGINGGDFVLVRQQPSAQDGDRVVALIDGEATIKKFHRTNEAIVLKPCSKNKKHKPIILTADFQVQGVVVTAIPKLE